MKNYSTEPSEQIEQDNTKLRSSFELSSESQIPLAQENPVELMVRAHQRIRTLEQDNQILRMHIDLLTKDNTQFKERLVKANNQKENSQKNNQNLQKKIMDLQNEINQLKAFPLNNSFFDKENRINEGKYQNKILPFSKKYEGNTEIKNQFDKLKLFAFQNSQSQFKDSQKKHQRVYSKVETPNYDNFSSTTSFEKTKKPQLLLHRNYSQNIFEKYETDRHQDYKKSLEQKILEASSSSTKNINITAKAQYRSPMIRKNSPVSSKIQRDTELQSTSFSNNYSSTVSTDSLHQRKFVYTNWRKTNNSLSVWKSPIETNLKYIALNR